MTGMSLRVIEAYAPDDPRRGWAYVIGEGPTSAVYDDAMYLAEIGEVEAAKGALREIFYRHLDTARALARATNTEPGEMPLPLSLGEPRRVGYGGKLGMVEDRGEPVKESVRAVRSVGDPDA